MNIVRRCVQISLLACLILVALAPAATGQSAPKVQLAIIIDGSQSLSAVEFELEKDGLADALSRPAAMPRDGSVELCIVQIGASGVFGGRTHIELEPAVVTEGSIEAIIELVRGIQQGRGYTPLAGGIRVSTRLITESPNFAAARHQVINVATDGMPFDRLKFAEIPREDVFAISEQDALEARNEAVGAGIDELDVEALGDLGQRASQRDFLRALVYPQPGAIVPPDQMKPGFARITVAYDDFDQALISKLRIALQPEPAPTPIPPAEIPEANSLLLLASGLSSLGAVWGIAKARASH